MLEVSDASIPLSFFFTERVGLLMRLLHSIELFRPNKRSWLKSALIGSAQIGSQWESQTCVNPLIYLLELSVMCGFVIILHQLDVYCIIQMYEISIPRTNSSGLCSGGVTVVV